MRFLFRFKLVSLVLLVALCGQFIAVSVMAKGLSEMAVLIQVVEEIDGQKRPIKGAYVGLSRISFDSLGSCGDIMDPLYNWDTYNKVPRKTDLPESKADLPWAVTDENGFVGFKLTFGESKIVSCLEGLIYRPQKGFVDYGTGNKFGFCMNLQDIGEPCSWENVKSGVVEEIWGNIWIDVSTSLEGVLNKLKIPTKLHEIALHILTQILKITVKIPGLASVAMLTNYGGAQITLGPLIGYNWKSIDFGEVKTGSCGDVTLGIWNPGEGCLDVDLWITGPNSGNFTVSPSYDCCIRSGIVKNFTVSFCPTEKKDFSATLRITHNGANYDSSIEIPLKGRGLTPPTAPSNLSANRVSSSEISLTWVDNSDNEDGFEIERKCDSCLGRPPYTRIATVGRNIKEYSDTGLSSHTRYCYQVQAVNAAGKSGYSNHACASTSTQDSDNDGIPDDEDDCRYDPGPRCTSGCPDRDGDCVRDSRDNCPHKYGPSCNNGCPTVCGNGRCECDEDRYNCSTDCGPPPVCGNRICESGETRSNCPEDCGGDPPIYGNIIAFPTPEHFLGQDLNGDSDTDDTVLRYKNIETGEVVNTGELVSGATHSVDIYENIIAFARIGASIRYYDINTGTFGDTGAGGLRPSIYENIITFSSGGRIHYYDVHTQTLVDTKVAGLTPTIYRKSIAFESDGTIRYFDLRTGTVVDTGIVGSKPALYENLIAFETPESMAKQDLNGDGDTYDIVICYYDISTGRLVNTEATGFFPAIHGNTIVFTTSEFAVGQDLDGDGEIRTQAIRYYDIASGTVVNTGKSGTEPDVYENTISFYTWERWAAQDLNGDGDTSDPIVQYCRTAPIQEAIATTTDE